MTHYADHAILPATESKEDAIGFAESLRDAIQRSGLTLERVVEAAEEPGGTLAMSTLSHWQSGRSAPTRRSSLEPSTALKACSDWNPVRRGYWSSRRMVVTRRAVESRMSPMAASFSNGELRRASDADQPARPLPDGEDHSKGSLLVR